MHPAHDLTPQTRWPWWWAFGALAVLLLWQLLFWALVDRVERAARPAAMDQRGDVAYLLLDAGGAALVDGAGRAARQGLDGYPVSLPRSHDAAGVRFLVPFDVDDPQSPLALFLGIREQVTQVRLNGHLLQASEPLQRLQGLLTSEPGYYALPPPHLHRGPNRLEIDKARVGFDSALSEFAIGPAAALADAFRWKNLLLTDLPLVGVGVLVFTLLLCLAVNWPREDRPRIRALMVLLGSCALSTWFLTFSPPVDLGLFGSLLLWCLINLAIALSMLRYVWFDTRLAHYPSRWMLPLGTLIAALFLSGFVVAAVADDPRYWLFLLLHAAYWVVIGVVLLALLVLAGSVVQDRGRRGFERSVLALCFSALAMDRLGSMYDLHSPFDATLPLSLPWSPLVGTLLGLSIVFALAREAAHARRTVLDANRVLTQTLAAREAELAASFAERKEILRRSAVLEERGRIVRDMHDGVGGQLVRLQAQLRTQGLAPEALADALDDSLGDLRLIVDALDSAEDGLRDALQAFERRLRQQAGTCRIRGDYPAEDVPDQFGARVILQVLRILQEAVSNALRHGDASELHLRMALDPGSQRLKIALRDNGRGVDAAAAPGRGLANMRQRAAAIGAELGLHSDATGTTVSLRLAPPDAAPV
jgi:two-component system sensor histidine kinase UhpB